MTVNKKKIIAAAALVGSVALLAGGTLAYFTDTDTKSTTLQVSKVSVAVNVTDTNLTGLLPGDSKAYTVTASKEDTGDADAYVRIKVTIPAAIVNMLEISLDSEKLTNGEIKAVAEDGRDFYAGHTAGYVANHEYTGTTDANGNRVLTFVINTKLTGGSTKSPITALGLKASATQDVIETIDAEKMKITVDAEAIQAAGFDSATAAFAAYDN